MVIFSLFIHLSNLSKYQISIFYVIKSSTTDISNLARFSLSVLYLLGVFLSHVDISPSVSLQPRTPGLRFLGLCECPFRKIDVDENQRISTDELKEQMLLDVDMGLTPFLVIGCAGTCLVFRGLGPLNPEILPGFRQI